ncbi:ribosomal RNA-processing protein 14-C [Fagus crenata]
MISLSFIVALFSIVQMKNKMQRPITDLKVDTAKKESRENIKKARREKSSTTTLDLLKKSLEKEKSSESDDEEIEIKVKLEELQQWLQQKKRKRDNVSEEKKSTSSSADKVEKDVAEALRELAFSLVKLGNEEEHGKKKRRLSKFKALERAKKLEEAMRDLEKGEIILKKHSWKSATSRAAGMKVHDGPSLLKRSIYKKKKRHQKNAEKWKERVQTTHKMKGEKQKKRIENIAHKERVQS